MSRLNDVLQAQKEIIESVLSSDEETHNEAVQTVALLQISQSLAMIVDKLNEEL